MWIYYEQVWIYNVIYFTECAGCGSSVNRCELAEHHMRCEAIAAALRDEDELLQAVGQLIYLQQFQLS